jgi:hypothetical protein
MSGTAFINCEDHRKLLIDIFFAVIITIGFDKFLHDFLIPHIEYLDSFDFPSLFGVLSVPPFIFNMLFFFVTYFWVISHWIFYHELIKKYPYYRCGKFLADVAIFSIMFVIINISFLAYDNAILPLFILLIAIWYLLACLWHLSDKGLRPLHRYLDPHILRLATFVFLLVLAYDPLSLGTNFEWYHHMVMSSVIVAMVSWNLFRLKIYLDKDSREYNIDYVEGLNGCSSQSKGGKLLIEIYKRNTKVKNNNEVKIDTMTFVAPNPGKKIIPAKKILGGRIIERSNDRLEEDRGVLEDDVMIEIPWYEDGHIVKPVFKVKEKIVKEVLGGINDLIKQDIKADSSW